MLTQMIIILLATCLRNKSWVQTFYSFRRCFVTIAGPSTSRSTFQAFFFLCSSFRRNTEIQFKLRREPPPPPLKSPPTLFNISKEFNKEEVIAIGPARLRGVPTREQGMSLVP